MLNVTKKAVSLLLIFVLSLSLGCCALEQRIDFSECVRRINRCYGTYEISDKDAFFSENEWFLFADTLGEDDILITGTEGEGRLLTRLSVSVINNGITGQEEIFIDLCEAAVNAFCENADKKKILADSHVCDEGVLFTENAFFSENGRFATSLYTAGMGCTLVIEIIR